VPTLILDPPPAELEALIELRRRLGLDRRDEVWEGVLHLNPPPSRKHEQIASQLHRLLGPYADAAGLELLGTVGIGVVDDNRVPDLVLQLPEDARPQWQETAAIAVEIRSPGDESLKKFGFYAAHKIDEVVIIDPETRSVEWLGLAGDDYCPLDRSGLLTFGPAELAGQLDWDR
jgi:Uma2 family endonuclease